MAYYIYTNLQQEVIKYIEAGDFVSLNVLKLMVTLLYFSTYFK